MKIRVRSGDTLWHYSSLFKVPLNLILDSNPEISPTNLKANENIIIPGYKSVPYEIKTGDTFLKIAATRNLNIEAIKILNQEEDADQLVVGGTVFLPQRITKSISSSTLPYDFKNLTIVINNLKKVYPFISVTTIGASVLGKQIQEIRIGRGAKKVHMNASFHANEWITTMVIMSLLNRYLLSLTNGNKMRGLNAMNLYQAVTLSIVPMVNPDGVDLVLNGPPPNLRDEVMKINDGSEDFVHWKANIRGVDLNKQYPANWELVLMRKKQPLSPAPRDYPGCIPLSEPEAIAIAELTKSNHFDCILAFHTQGKEFYWGYEGFEPAISEEIAKEFERVSGYQAIRYVDSHAGYKDWYIQEFKRPGFTLELGKGINPLPLSQFQEILENVEGIFLAALYL